MSTTAFSGQDTVSSLPEGGLVPAAEYVRMSTEFQQFSLANQQAAIRRYAAKHHYRIVRTYVDHGKSGLRLEGREALQQLLSDAHHSLLGQRRGVNATVVAPAADRAPRKPPCGQDRDFADPGVARLHGQFATASSATHRQQGGLRHSQVAVTAWDGCVFGVESIAEQPRQEHDG